MILPGSFNPDFDGLAQVLSTTEPTVSIRLNPRRLNIDTVGGDRVPWCDAGRYLERRPDFTFDPAMHQGVYYVQDASSMVHNHIVRQISATAARPLAALDACAAPGGKTTAMIDALPAGSLVVANEYMPQRAQVLHENLVKWGCADVVVACGDTSRLSALGGMFDIIVADVPCSGEGMFRKDPEAVTQWTPQLVEECAALQRTIVGNLWPALAPGGYMIYSTCTFNRSENEDNLAWMLANLEGAQLVEIQVPADCELVRRDGMVHFLPGRIRGEGLTVGLLRKSPDLPQPKRLISRDDNRKTPAVDASLRDYVSSTQYTLIRNKQDTVFAVPSAWLPQIGALQRHLHLPFGCGVEVAALKGRDYVPSHALAMSTLLNTGRFPSVDVDYTCAIAYLRREAVALPVDTPRGHVLLTYGGRPLGWVKNVGNRANNLYPQPWRIFSTHVPDTPPQIIHPL